MATASKRLRFEVLRRDNFACRYCGRAAPEVKLTVDAVVPEALGGSHKDPANLVAACGDCNGGKTSSHPDAPLVADVAQDALRWSRAMQAAAAEALGDGEDLGDAQHRFAALWSQWTYSGDDGKRRKYPKDPSWQQSVDALTAAGLPIALLEECIQITMARTKIAPENRFRYMCGVAWNKVTELQERARALAREPLPDEDEELSDDMIRGRADLARELLGDLDKEDIDRLLEDARSEHYQAETPDEEAIAAVQIAWHEQRTGLSWLIFSVCDLMPAIPDEVMATAMRETRAELYDENGPDISREEFANRVCTKAVRGYEVAGAKAYLDAMPDDERAEWLEYADALYGKRLSPNWRVINAATCARAIKERNRYYHAMCRSRGRVIPDCPALGKFHVWVYETECCKEEGHPGHVICERHLDELVSGNHPRYTVRDYAEIPEPEVAEVEAPF